MDQHFMVASKEVVVRIQGASACRLASTNSKEAAREVTLFEFEREVG